MQPKKTYYTTKQVQDYLREHVIRGDSGDGIPNILSPDDVFVSGGRQKPIMTVKVEQWINQKPEEFCTTEDMKRNYVRNKMLIDLDEIPKDVREAVLNEFDIPIEGNHSKIYGYLLKNRMRNLIESVGDF